MKRLKHIVIAMNPLLGLSYIRHHGLPAERTTIVCSKHDVDFRLDGLDIHDLSIHVANDEYGISSSTELFQAIIRHCHAQ